MEKYTDANCEVCDEDLIQLDGEWFCPSCEELSAFDLRPGENKFSL